MKPGLSVHMMVLDPPVDRMAMLVEYLSTIADEVVVVDTGSGHQTLETISELPKVRVVERPFVDFSTTRNQGLDQHQHEWTLGIDPDELPSPIMMQHLSWVVKEGGTAYPDAKGYLYWTKNYWAGRRGPEMEYHWHARLWRTASGRLYRPIHELLELDGLPETKTRGTPILPKAPRMAYLIHAKSDDEIAKADELYDRLGDNTR